MRSRPELSLALGVVALGVFLLARVVQIGAGAGYDRIGPRFFPYVVAIGLMVLGGWCAVSSWRNRRSARGPLPGHELTGPLNWRSFGYLGLSFLLCLALLESVGFVIGASVQFWLVTRAFDSRRPVRDAMVAVLVAASVYVSFSRGLGLALPPGLLEGLL
jgi:putative tricarboxylic transport membrane protein